MSRLPVAFVPHGGGPWPFVDLGLDPAEVRSLGAYLRALGSFAPKASQVVIISAHWEEAVPTVQTHAKPPMLYDYYGFPPASYSLQWPAPGSPALAAEVRRLLANAGVESAEDAERGYDHGSFIPLMLTYPQAQLPAVQLSLKKGLDPEEHLAIGRALAPLRDQGVFLVGSGMSYHNMRGFRDPRSRPISEAFDAWLVDAATAEPNARNEKLKAWEQAPHARAVHPREEHLLPLMVIAGAAEADRGVVGFSGTMFGMRISAFHYGVS